jgi:AraC-like DNA-binding protein
MNVEITARIGDSVCAVYIQNGFYLSQPPTGHLHKHSYTEFHFITGGSARFSVDGTIHEIPKNTVFAVPSDALHSCISCEEHTLHTAFQINAPLPCFSAHNAEPELLASFFREVESCRPDSSFAKLSAYITLLCSDFYPDRQICGRKIENYAFILYEFFSNHYSRDVRLLDLAKELHLSEKQAERIVQKYTGHTFGEELLTHRMFTANYLMERGEMPLTEIARYVGYQSYSGFWKAYRKYFG